MKVLQNEKKLIFSLLPFSFVHLIFLRFLFLWSEIGLDIKEGSAHQSLLSSGPLRSRYWSVLMWEWESMSTASFHFLSCLRLFWDDLAWKQLRWGKEWDSGLERVTRAFWLLAKMKEWFGFAVQAVRLHRAGTESKIAHSLWLSESALSNFQVLQANSSLRGGIH